MLNDGAQAKLAAAAAECRLHAEVLTGALQEIEPVLPYDAVKAGAITPEQRRLLDQIAYRFGKLQDSLGEKLLPGLLWLAQEPIAPQAAWLNRLMASIPVLLRLAGQALAFAARLQSTR